MATDVPKSSEEMIEDARRAFEAQAVPPPVSNAPGEANQTPAAESPSPGTVDAEPSPLEAQVPEYLEPRPAPPPELPPELQDLEEPEPGLVTRLWARRGVAVALILGGIFVYSTFFDDTKPVESLGPGECIDDPGLETVVDIETIDCAEPHDYEVFATVTIPGGDIYPDDFTLLTTAWDECSEHFEEYVGASYAASVLYIHAMVPTIEGWAEGDRGATCLLFEVDAADNLVKASGTARQSGV